MNYDYYTTGTYDYSGLLGALAGMLIFVTIIALAITIFTIIVTWKIFKKAGKEGWIAIIPLYNVYTLFEITWGNGWYCLLLLTSIIPVLGWIACIVITIITMVKLAKVFGKEGGFAVGLIFLNTIFLAILAFDKSTYIGIPTSNMQPAGPIPPQSSTNTTSISVENNPADNLQSANEINSNPTLEQTPNITFCTNCGQSLPEGTIFCPNCGTPKTS